MTFWVKKSLKLKFKEKIKNIKAIGFDVDGVLTNGTLTYFKNKEYKFFYVQDGVGLILLKIAGIKTFIVTGKSSEIFKKRRKEIGIDYIYEKVKNKVFAIEDFLKKEKLKWYEICYMGDDLQDIPVMKKVGFAVAPSNSCDDVKKTAHFICKNSGGNGAVRELIELVLKEQKKWKKIVNMYLQSLLEN